jgi:hypothetical protein
MREHHVKSWPEFFEATFSGVKTFEIRRNERDYQVGDVLVLEEWEPNTASMANGGSYTGRKLRKLVTYVLRGVGDGGGSGIAPLRGLSRGYVILGLAEPMP